MINNLINGNLSDAKTQAQSMAAGWEKISRFIREHYGWNETKADLAARYLKGENCWQAYCDAE